MWTKGIVKLRLMIALGVLCCTFRIGADWQVPRQVSHTPGYSTQPSVTYSSSGQIFVAWQEGAQSTYPEVYFSSLVDGSWSSPQNLSQSANLHSYQPGIGYLPGHKTLCLIWYEEENMLSSVVYAKLSQDGGKSWSEAEQLSSGFESVSQFPHFVVDGQGQGHLVWSELFTDHSEPYFDVVYRHFNGQAWSEQENASRAKVHSADHPSVWGNGANSASVLYLNNTKNSHTEPTWTIATAWKTGGEWLGPKELYSGGRTPIFTRIVKTGYDETYYFFHTRGPGVGDLYYCYQKSPGAPVSAAKHFAAGMKDLTRFSAIESRSGTVHVFSGGPTGLSHHLFQDGELSLNETVTTIPSENPCAVYNRDSNQIVVVFQNSQNNEIFISYGEEPYEGEIDPNVNRPPVARITVDRKEGLCPLTVNFDAQNSYDRDGSIVAYYWDFGDGDRASGVKARHVYSKTGDYSVVLRVVDDKGANGTSYISVQAQGVEPPLGTKVKYLINRSLLRAEHFFRIEWKENPVNLERGFSIVTYRIYRRHRDEGQYNLIAGVDVGQEMVYLDRSLKGDYIPYLYAVTAVDVNGFESPLPIIY